MKTLSPERMARFREMAEEYPNLRSALLMTLRLAEEEFGCIDDEAMELVASLCQVSPAHVQGMVSFYTHFKRPWHGQHRFMVCATLMCAMKNNTKDALAQIKAKLNLEPGQRTRDGLFSCEKVECLADCDRPPVIQVDSDHHVKMKGPALDKLMDDLLAKHGKTAAEYLAQQPVAMDTKVAHLPVQHHFAGEEDAGGNRQLARDREAGAHVVENAMGSNKPTGAR